MGVVLGCMFLKKDGSDAKAADFEEALVERLECIQQTRWELFP
jgi:hypothetical protein